MQKIIIPTLLILLTSLSCRLEEINVNPNDPTDVPVETMLPAAQRALASAMTGDAAVLAGIFSNYFEGIENRFLPAERYVVDRDFLMRPIWGDFYLDALTTFHLIREKAVETGSPHYEGVARILTVLGIGTVTDLWGEVPFTKAFGGPDNLSPEYDDQEDIYLRMEQELNRAVSALAETESVFSPGSDDLFFAGDREAWIRVANSLLVRIRLRQVNRKTLSMNSLLDLLDAGIQSREDALVYTYNEQESNPWYQFQTTTPYVKIDSDLDDLLDNDPRRDAMLKITFGEKQIGPYYASQFSPAFLLSYDEVLFLRAEILLRDGKLQAAEDALRAAVSEHIDRVTEGSANPGEVADFLDTYTNLTGDPDSDLEKLLRQKYIAMFTTTEAWADYRRTGLPVLLPNPDGENPDNPGGEIPRRFLYPLNEILYNPNIPAPQPNLQKPVWWDQNG